MKTNNQFGLDSFYARQAEIRRQAARNVNRRLALIALVVVAVLIYANGGVQ